MRSEAKRVRGSSPCNRRIASGGYGEVQRCGLRADPVPSPSASRFSAVSEGSPRTGGRHHARSPARTNSHTAQATRGRYPPPAGSTYDARNRGQARHVTEDGRGAHRTIDADALRTPTELTRRSGARSARGSSLARSDSSAAALSCRHPKQIARPTVRVVVALRRFRVWIEPRGVSWSHPVLRKSARRCEVPIRGRAAAEYIGPHIARAREAVAVVRMCVEDADHHRARSRVPSDVVIIVPCVVSAAIPSATGASAPPSERSETSRSSASDAAVTVGRAPRNTPVCGAAPGR
jgi:hypothetical protein